MNILLVNHYATRPSRGVGARHYMLSKELAKKGHSVTLVASNFDHASRFENIALHNQEMATQDLEGVRYLWLKTPPYAGNGVARIYNMLIFSHKVRLLGRKHGLAKPDVIVGSSPHLFAAEAARLLAVQYSVPFVLEIRDLWPESFVALGGMSRRNPAIRYLELLENRLYRQSNQIISLLPGAAMHIAKAGVDRRKVTWIPNGIDVNLVPISQPKNNAVFTVIYAGAHGIANGLDSILDVACILQGRGLGDKVNIILIGDGQEKPRLQGRAADEGLRCVTFVDRVPRQEVWTYMQQADALIATLRDVDLYRYGISLNKLYDYMASAKPVIFGANSLNNPIEESGAGITVAPENPEAMADTIEGLMDMSLEQRSELGLRGRKYVELHNQYSTLAEKVECVLERSLQKT